MTERNWALLSDIKNEMDLGKTYADLFENGWRHYGTETKSYEQTFSSFLKELGYTTFDELLQSRYTKTGQMQSVLDLMAPVSSLVERLAKTDYCGTTSAVTYRERRGAETMTSTELSRNDIHPFYGDILGRKVWRKLERLREEKDMPGFDLIVCRPSGPFRETIYMKPLIFSHSLARAYELLNPDNGILMTQLPPMSYDQDGFDWEDFEAWNQQLCQFNINSSISMYCKGIFAEADFMMVRGEGSPVYLPRISG